MITVLTPTYNREKLLHRVYESLCRQTNKDFEWLIVDDGSTDNTKEYVDKWIDENKIVIRYIYQSNAGKARAFNKGVENAKDELFLCLDSDDYLVDDAIDAIISGNNNITDSNVAGIIARKCDDTGKDLGDKFPENIQYIDTFSLSEQYHCNGEWTLIYKTDILKKHSFPEIDGEKFVTECVLYDQLAQSYDMLLLDKVIEICEYQPEGLTSNIYKSLIENPTGYKIYYKQRIDITKSWKTRLIYIIKYNAFKCMSNDKEYDYKGKYKLLVKALGITGIIGKSYYMGRYKQN